MTQSSPAARGSWFLPVLFLVFLILKLGVGDTAVVDWSWWWVTAPLWAGYLVLIVGLLLVGIVVGIIRLFESDQSKANRRARNAINEISRYYR